SDAGSAVSRHWRCFRLAFLMARPAVLATAAELVAKSMITAEKSLFLQIVSGCSGSWQQSAKLALSCRFSSCRCGPLGGQAAGKASEILQIFARLYSRGRDFSPHTRCLRRSTPIRAANVEAQYHKKGRKRPCLG